LRPGNLVVLESTSPPGTTLSLIPILEESGLRVGEEILLAHSPERVLPGRILTELVHNDRVVGGHTDAAAAAVADLYRSFAKGEILLTDATTAEMVKLMENTYRDVNVALANEFGRVAATVGVDVHRAIALANHHPRVGIHTPGPGVGGHCIAVDPWFIVDAAPDDTVLIRAARAVNDGQPARAAALVLDVLADVPDPIVAALGLAYKADVDDLRESPSLEVVRLLRAAGCEVRVHDAHARHLPDGTPLQPALGPLLRGADAIVVLTDHAEYRRLHPEDAAPAGMRRRIAVDTRLCLDADLWREAGFAVHRLGDGAVGSRAPSPMGVPA
jgi:UDP-N-acetyl-D-mannosaminuronic acid dehydrogenase